MLTRLEEMANIPGIFKQRSKRLKICWRGIIWIFYGSTYKLEIKKKKKKKKKEKSMMTKIFFFAFDNIEFEVRFDQNLSICLN